MSTLQDDERAQPVGKCRIRCKVISALASNAPHAPDRFGKYAAVHFDKFIKAFKKHPEWEEYFDDLGKGDAPTEYLVLIEEGLRSFGSDMHAMGTKAMDTKERWIAVRIWRKREAYIACIRTIRKKFTYPQWDCYKLEVYAERQALHKTFVARHCGISNGTSNRLDDHLADPKHWSSTDDVAAPPPFKRPKKEPAIKGGSPVVAVHTKPMVWDVENNCFVPFEQHACKVGMSDM